jgi:hypothetical protein
MALNESAYARRDFQFACNKALWLEKRIMLHSLTAGHSGVTATAAAIARSAYRVSFAKIAA